MFRSKIGQNVLLWSIRTESANMHLNKKLKKCFKNLRDLKAGWHEWHKHFEALTPRWTTVMKLFAWLHWLLPEYICNTNKLHGPRQVMARYCNFSTSSEHSSIRPRQRPPLYESPRLRISNFQSPCVSTQEDATVRWGQVMRQADSAAWEWESDHTYTHARCHTNKHTHKV